MRLATSVIVAVLMSLSGALAAEPSAPTLPGVTVPVIDAQSLAAARRLKRMALVIGNSRYPTAPLRKPRQDAQSMAALLRWLGYEVTSLEDLGGEAMERAVNEFAARLASTKAQGLFYYSGHGVQGQNGYLVPVDLSPGADEVAMRHRAVSVEYVLNKMETSREGIDVLIIDACRSNPYVRGVKGGEAVIRPIPAGKRSLVAFATRLGAVANEGPEEEKHSVFTQRLLTAMMEPGVKLRDALDEVQEGVRAKTREEQIPDYNSSLGTAPVFFIPKISGTPAPQVAGVSSEPMTPASTGPQPMKAGTVFRDPFTDGTGTGPDLVVVPPGSYLMGSPAKEPERYGDEGPQHKVTIGNTLGVGRYEVTFAEWDACVAGGGCLGYRPKDEGWGRGRRPVINVSWADAHSYVDWLSRKTGKTYRILSESEWEYSARAGTTTAFGTGDRITPDQANFDGTYTYNGSAKGVYRGKTVEVGSFPANGFGLSDLHGNVREWVEDCWHDGYDKPTPAPADGSAWTSACAENRRVARGGSWSSSPRNLRAADRVRNAPVDRYTNVGFRVARTITP